MIDKATAIASLRPNTQWTMIDNDVESIDWITPNVIPLTEKEVKDEMTRLQQSIDKTKADLFNRLGITADEAALLFE